MELVVEDRAGRVLGTRDLEGSRWEQVDSVFENIQALAVTISVSGQFGDFYIKNGNDRIIGTTNDVGFLEIGSQFVLHDRKLRLSYHEQHTPVWGDKARDNGVGGSQIEFARDTEIELRNRAEEFQRVIANRRDVPQDVLASGQLLLASVDDLLATLRVSST